MVSQQVRLKTPKHVPETITIKTISDFDPNHLIGIKTSRVYSQIARISRHPNKQNEKALLITALESACIKSIVNGKIVKRDPPYVPMTADQIRLCFGRHVDRLPASSFVKL